MSTVLQVIICRPRGRYPRQRVVDGIRFEPEGGEELRKAVRAWVRRTHPGYEIVHYGPAEGAKTGGGNAIQ